MAFGIQFCLKERKVVYNQLNRSAQVSSLVLTQQEVSFMDYDFLMDKQNKNTF